MTDAKTGANPTDAEIARRVQNLEQQAKSLTLAVKNAEAMLRPPDPAKKRALESENTRFAEELRKLQSFLLSAGLASLKPRTSEEGEQRIDALKSDAIDCFQRMNVDIELWKNIVS